MVRVLSNKDRERPVNADDMILVRQVEKDGDEGCSERYVLKVRSP